MRASRGAAAESKARIVATASKMLRARGLEGASIVDVMAAAGMTHGGFYKHFATKDDLNAAAVSAAFGEILDHFDARKSAGGVEAAIRAYVEEYLSTEHIERPDMGCPVAALGADAGRRSEALSAEFAAGAEGLIGRLSRSAPAGTEREKARADAIQCLATLVGAVVVARAVGAGPLRDEVLAACAAPQALLPVHGEKMAP
jgi:TetR/AcrR family transcriptional regulator, transcriptional repressor for nem operon